MARIIGQIDSLTRLLNIFEENEINLFKSLEEIMHFNTNYNYIIKDIHNEVIDAVKNQIENYKITIPKLVEDYNQKITEREAELLQEKETISSQIAQYSITPDNIFKRLYFELQLFILNKRKDNLENNFEAKKKKPYSDFEKRINDQNTDLSYLESNFEKVVQERLQAIENEYSKARSLLKEQISVYFGAIGEQKAVNALSSLPDSYYIINDFHLLINPAIYNKSTGDYIQSVQADHIVIGPSGVFLIETKNWSKDSVNNRDFYSPVEQIKRSSYALFIYLNNSNNYDNAILDHHWGSRKVSVHNILLMINNKPDQEFQYVKILSLNEILGYIKYFKPIFSSEEVQAIYKLLS
jgi:hypothetical protein